jgi:flagellin
MTRINTNVSSLSSQARLQRTNKDLQQSLTRLSTGLRINSGADDPAGLIASESLRSDITSLNKALSNTQRASQIIATADSALGQVSTLLNDVRGLVVEAANNGALSDDEIAANQLQIDSSLEAINRISQTTTFQGRKLLDGSLDFLTKSGAGFSTVSDLHVDQANLGATGKVSVNINISAAATKATVNNTGIAASTTAAKSTGTITFGTPDPADEAVLSVALGAAYTVGAEASGTVSLANSYVPNAEASATDVTLGSSGIQLNIAASNGGAADGLKGNSTRIVVTTNGTATTANYDAASDTLTLDLQTGANQATIVSALDTALNGTFDVTAGTAAGTSVAAGDAGAFTGLFTGGSNTVAAGTFQLSAVNGGAADGLKGNSTSVVFTSGASNAAAYNSTNNTITVTVADGATVSDITNTINTSLGATFLASNTTNGSYRFSTADNGANAATLTGGTDPVAAAQLNLTATDGGAADGTKANTTEVVFATGASTAATFDAATNRLNITVADGATVNDIVSAINTDNTFQVSPTTLNGTSKFGAGDLGTKTPTVVTPGTDDSLDDVITVKAKASSAAFDKSITFVTSNAVAAGTATASINGSGNIEILTRNSGNVSISAIRDAINNLDDYEATVTTSDGDGVYSVGTDTAPTIANLTGGTQGGGLDADVVFQLSGGTGSEVFQFQKGASLDSIVQSINLVKDATGVEATNDGGNLQLTSSQYGSKGTVSIDVITEGVGGTFKSGLSSNRATGKDIAATVNGYNATGDGNTLSINTSSLDLTLTVADGSSTSVNFDITGGGALFQLGGDVVSNQQARLGIASLSTGKLGGSSGRLYELGSGQSKALGTDASGAARVIDEVINKVTSLRGRLGAFQRTTLDSNSVSLQDTVLNLQEAQSSIRDADFASESANLTRAQILSQSGTSVLAIANQNPQNVLSLLR